MKEIIDKSAMENTLSQKEFDKRDTYILTAIIIGTFSALFWFLMAKYAESTDNYDIYGTFEYFGFLVSLGVSAVPVLLALAIKSNKWKTPALILAIICATIKLYWLVQAMLPKEEFVVFEF